ncbi:anthranilate synthase component I family protein [Paraflavitalea sp. CAU 1676]|uniref:anthranilate synthase component I family protein n=1 Tax=Paraflavitalea sp. CAU 1676 TaxID=3032598 RepID=UPI0023DA1CEF|nr:anthranilate synthase component I family protein [Paraflavitalea sp. CAU 1676]MDF2187419.1 anthranilate synthase component I family protein [Paraflavitalea sp. CAU 1676]
MLNWCNRFNICCFLDNQHYPSALHRYECLLAAGATHTLQATTGDNAFSLLRSFYELHKDWLFGHLAYDLKNELEPLTSNHPDGIGFPDLFFYVPAVILQLGETELMIGTLQDDAESIFEAIMEMPAEDQVKKGGGFSVQPRFTRDEYLQVIKDLQQHILRGDCYEINFCQEFYATAVIDPWQVYHALCEASPNPFAAFYRSGDQYLMCASPERYLNKQGQRLFSQPIKGTWQRDITNQVSDQENKEQLFHSAKDRSENVMVVDLVRNDLSKVCEEGSVQVDELFGIYSFPQVHQMISTVSGMLRPDVHFIDAIRDTFPMGSMTGAPKRRVMELIEQYERTRRGLFSGSVGYITPEGNFDFNVVIRSILYNSATQYLSYQVGSGITFYSDPVGEYEECLLKAAAIRRVLGG